MWMMESWQLPSLLAATVLTAIVSLPWAEAGTKGRSGEVESCFGAEAATSPPQSHSRLTSRVLSTKHRRLAGSGRPGSSI